MAGEIDGKIHLKTEKICWFLITYKEVKPHPSEESMYKVVEGERDDDDNGEYVY